MNLRDLHEQRGRAVAAMRTMTDDPKGDGDLSAEQVAEFDKLKGQVETFEQRIARQQFVDEADRRATGTAIAGTGDSRFDSELRSFSLLRAIAGQVPDLHVDAGREREVSAELQRRSGRVHSGITCPLAAVFERRVQASHTATAGGFLVADQFRGDLFVDTLRAKLVTGRLGATVLNGLSGQVQIPTRTASSTAQWVSEDTSIDLSDPSFGQLTMVPRTVAARTELTRNLLMQSSPDAEQLTRNDFASVLAEAIDTAAINGSGIGAVPKGLLNTAGIGTFNLATVNWANLMAAVERIQTANADEGALGWATNPHVVKVLRTTLKTTADTASNMMMTDAASLAGYPLVASTIVPANVGAGSTKSALIFGNWNDLLIGYCGSFDLLVNPHESTAYAKGNIQVRSMLNTDVNVRRLLSFTAATDIV